VAALKKLAAQGLFVEPTCAHAAAALDELTRRGTIKPNERTVVVMTGTGIKSAGYIAELFAEAA
jgi:threonine synthase